MDFGYRLRQSEQAANRPMTTRTALKASEYGCIIRYEGPSGPFFIVADERPAKTKETIEKELVMAKRVWEMLTGASAILALSACGGGGDTTSEAASQMLDNGRTVAEQIEFRQDQFKTFGASFKTVNDQLNSGSPDIAEIQSATAAVLAASEGMADWFPAGTGPAAGVKTEALAIIWEEPGDFQQKVSDAQAAIAAFNAVAQGGDLAAIPAAFRNTGGTCKACHDKYRLDD